MKKLTILVDMDDTIENLLYTWVTYLDEKYGLDVRYEDIKDWEMERTFTMLSSDQIFMPLRDADLWKRVKPLPGAVETLQKFIEDGHEVYIVTASHIDTVHMKMNEVLFKYFPYIDYKHIIISSQKQMIRGDVLIDDAPFNLIGGEYIGILMNAPHNESFDAESNNLFRMLEWDEVYNFVTDISRKG